jgi:hypothetical protein
MAGQAQALLSFPALAVAAQVLAAVRQEAQAVVVLAVLELLTPALRMRAVVEEQPTAPLALAAQAALAAAVLAA